MKKIVIVFLATIVLVAFCSCGNNGKEVGDTNINSGTVVESDSITKKDELIYNSTELFDYTEVDGGISIIGFKNYDHIEYSKIIIPSEIDNKKVVGIGALGDIDYFVFGVFASECEVVIPDTVLYIGGRAFFNAKNLVKVSGGENCKTIGDRAFAECKDLREITFYNELEEISSSAFIGCEKLTQIKN